MEAASTITRESGMLPGMKLFVITRQDLGSGPQAVQSCHAFMQFIWEHAEVGKKWFECSNTLSFLVAKDEEHLRKLLQHAHDLGIRCSQFLEPDLKNQLTAIALEPGRRSQKLVSKLPTLGEK